MPRKIIAPQRREQIVEALFQCLSEKGHESITVKDIASRADLHYGVIHYYFKSKDDIVSALADSLISKYEDALRARMRRLGSASEQLQVALDFFVDEFIFNRPLNRVFYNLVQMAFERETVRSALRRQLQVYRDRIADMVRKGIESGEFAQVDPAQTASLMVALIEGMALQWEVEAKALKRNEAKRLIADTLTRHLTDSR
jgi:AcrR family transcriptional regulator